MPELPDVEGYRIILNRALPGSRIHSVRVLDSAVLRNSTAYEFADRLTGCRFQETCRHGKWLILPTDGPTLLIHNGMTGRPYFITARHQPDTPIDRNDRLVVTTNLGELRYADLRKLRGVWIVDHPEEISAVTGEQGPDVLDLSATAFRVAVRGRRGALKAVLMNQRVLAGIGNMLSDEICWRARLHPARAMNTLDDDEVHNLHAVMRRVIRAATKQGRIPRTRSWLNAARDRDPAKCPRCKTTLRRTPIGGRTSIWCPHCQPADQ